MGGRSGTQAGKAEWENRRNRGEKGEEGGRRKGDIEVRRRWGGERRGVEGEKK